MGGGEYDRSGPQYKSKDIGMRGFGNRGDRGGFGSGNSDSRTSAYSTPQSYSNQDDSSSFGGMRGGGQGFRGGRGGGSSYVASGGSSSGKEVSSIYVINIDPNTTDGELHEAFKKNADGVTKSRILLDKDGISKSSGFVEFASPADAQNAINTCQNLELGNKRLIVQMARQ